jgi:hypothetical protein
MSAVKACYLDLLNKAHDTVVVFMAPDCPTIDSEKVGFSRNTPNT